MNTGKAKSCLLEDEKQTYNYLYARYLCSRAHSAKRARDDRVSCIQYNYQYIAIRDTTVFPSTAIQLN